MSEIGIYGQREDLPDAFVPPPRVMMAYNFVAMSVRNMGLRGFPVSSGLEVREQELHPKHEAAFSQACNCLGRYFAGESDG